MSLIPSAFAEGTAPAANAAGSSWMSFLPIVVIFILFWFLLIRPQQKKMKVHNQMLASLEKGTKVATNSGIIGTIINLDEKVVDLKVAEGVIIKIQRGSIAGKLDSESGVAK